MKKRSILVNFRFATGTAEYTESRIVSVKFNSNSHPTEQELSVFSCEVVAEWFHLTHPGSRLISVVGYCSLEVDYSDHPAAEVAHSGTSAIVTAKEARSLRMKLPDAYDVHTLNAGQVSQQIEQTAPYTDFLVLKGLMESDLIEALEAKGFYVNTMIDESARRNYTLIRWFE